MSSDDTTYDVNVSHSGLQDHATAWDELANAMGEIGQRVFGSEWVKPSGLFDVVVNPYNQVAGWIYDLSLEAQSEMHAISNALKASHYTYKENEQQIIGQIQQIIEQIPQTNL
ncbi:MAG: hypothetical protein J2P25_13975 [Nocardiopsaceae bacterium]|nr:hypothetical protein [Nocardiopsaceae bacterium]